MPSSSPAQGSAADAPPAFRLYRPRPGHPDWARLQAEAVEMAQRLLPRLEPPRGGVPELRRRWHSYATTARSFLRNRRLIRAGREDLRPLYFIWTLLRTCNFRCEYCDDHRGQRYPELPKDGVLSTEEGLQLLRVMRTGTPSVYFSGGEPTLRKDLPALTRAARDLDYFPIIINTNGSVIDSLLERDSWRTWLADTDIVIVSLDALDLPTLERMWVHPHPERVLRNLLLLRELSGPLRFKLMVNTVIQPDAAGHARDVLDFANDLGIWFCPVPVNTGPTVDRALRDDPGYLALVAAHPAAASRKAIRSAARARMLRRLLWSQPLTCRNTLKPHIDHDGRLFWPCKSSVNVEPRRLRVLDFEDVESLYQHAASQLDPTGFHGPGANQCGANCNWAQNYSTDTYAYGLQHPLSLVHDITEFLTGKGDARRRAARRASVTAPGRSTPPPSLAVGAAICVASHRPVVMTRRGARGAGAALPRLAAPAGAGARPVGVARAGVLRPVHGPRRRQRLEFRRAAPRVRLHRAAVVRDAPRAIPVWMLLYWGMILRFVATLCRWERLAPPPFPADDIHLGTRVITSPRLKVAGEIALTVATRQMIYAYYLDPLLSWLPFAAALVIYVAVFRLARHERVLLALAAIGGPAGRDRCSSRSAGCTSTISVGSAACRCGSFCGGCWRCSSGMISRRDCWRGWRARRCGHQAAETAEILSALGSPGCRPN